MALFDHLCQGRYVMGVGPGGLGSDFELFKTFDKNRSEMMVEAVEIIHKIWASDPPYRIPGKHWDITIDAQCQLHLGIGPMLKPYQRPYPPLAVSAMSPASSHRPARRRARLGAGLGEFHAGRARQDPLGAVLRRGRGRGPPARPGAVAARALDPGRREGRGGAGLPRRRSLRFGWYYKYLRDNLGTYKLLKIFKPASRCRTRR